MSTTDRQMVQGAIAELQTLASELDLRLPATRAILVQQVKQITTARYKLVRFDRRLQGVINQSPPSTLQAPCLRLSQVTHELIRKADSLTMIAEEFITDPAGAIACYRTINNRKLKLLEQFPSQVIRST